MTSKDLKENSRRDDRAVCCLTISRFATVTCCVGLFGNFIVMMVNDLSISGPFIKWPIERVISFYSSARSAIKETPSETRFDAKVLVLKLSQGLQISLM